MSACIYVLDDDTLGVGVDRMVFMHGCSPHAVDLRKRWFTVSTWYVYVSHCDSVCVEQVWAGEDAVLHFLALTVYACICVHGSSALWVKGY